MNARSFVAVIAIAALGTPLLADIPDGRGGRTSPQASPRPAIPPAHACCPRTVVVTTTPAPTSPAERKTIGEVAWASRHMTTAKETIPCYKMKTDPPRVYASSAELKASGHLNRVASKADAANCCDSLSCPMRKTV